MFYNSVRLETDITCGGFVPQALCGQDPMELATQSSRLRQAQRARPVRPRHWL